MTRLEIWDIVVADISLDTHRRLVTYTIYRYIYYSIFIFLFIPITHIYHDHWYILQVFLYLFNAEIIVYIVFIFYTEA